MAITLKDEVLDKNFKDHYLEEDGDVVTISDDALDGKWHANQPDSLGDTAVRSKKFFDYLARRVFLPWINGIAGAVNGLRTRMNALEVDTVPDLKRYAEEQIANLSASNEEAHSAILSETKEYTDGKVADLRESNDAAHTAILSETKGYTDGKVNDLSEGNEEAHSAILSETKEYTDSRVADLRESNDAAHTALLSEGKAYTDGKVAGVKTDLDAVRMLAESNEASLGDLEEELNKFIKGDDANHAETLRLAKAYVEEYVETEILGGEW